MTGWVVEKQPKMCLSVEIVEQNIPIVFVLLMMLGYVGGVVEKKNIKKGEILNDEKEKQNKNRI